jgi:DNA helicase-2/ATP-dependent DNA helicase PcrA
MGDPYEEAVFCRGGHLQIIACAGAGKTETMARRVASLLAEGVAPVGIIAFTFTEKAGRELKARIERKVSDWEGLGPGTLDKLGPMWVGTIHAFCMQVLQRFTPEIAAYDVLDDHKLMGLLSREYNVLRLDDLGGGGHRQNIELFRRSVDVVENELLDPNDLRATPFAASYGADLWPDDCLCGSGAGGRRQGL